MRHRKLKPTWRTSACSPTACSLAARRKFVAHQYIIAAQAKSSVDVPFGPWGCEGGAATRFDHYRAARVRPLSEPCFDYQTLGDELDSAKLTLALLYQQLHETIQRLWSRLPGGQAYLSRVPIGKSHHAAATISHRRCERQARSVHVGDAALPRFRSFDCGGGSGPRGSRRWSTRSARASSGIRRRSSCSGTTGAGSTITFRRRTKITTAGLPRTR